MPHLEPPQVSFAEYSLFYRALVQNRPITLRSLLIVATPYHREQAKRHASFTCDAILQGVLLIAPLVRLWVCVRVNVHVCGVWCVVCASACAHV